MSFLRDLADRVRDRATAPALQNPAVKQDQLKEVIWHF